MPELPDVAAYRKRFDTNATGKKITEVVIYDSGSVAGSTVDFRKNIEGKQFTGTKRYGKYLIAEIDSESCMVVHFGMDGFFDYRTKHQDEPRHTRVSVLFDDDTKVCYSNRRKIGKMELISDLQELVDRHKLGKDALEVSKEEFINTFEEKSGSIKPALMDQSFVAGIGNVYADEILFQSKLDPESKLNRISKEKLAEIYDNMIKVFKEAEKIDADPEKFPKEYLIGFRKKGGICPSTRDTVKYKRVGGRGTYFCPEVQEMVE